MNEKMVTLGKNGRLVIPAQYRRKMGVAEGDKLILRFEDNALRVMTPNQALRSAQELVRRYIPEGRSLSEELIAERRRESGDE